MGRSSRTTTSTSRRPRSNPSARSTSRPISTSEEHATPERARTTRPFLVTTSLEEFWDPAQPLVFVGEHCRRYSRRAFWSPLGGEVLSPPWDSQEELRDVYAYLRPLCERLLVRLGERLDALHGTRHASRYWRILLHPWLYYYVSISYEKYTELRAALDKHPDLTTLGLSSDCFVTPRDTLDFAQYQYQDAYHLQGYTRLLESLGTCFPRRSARVANDRFRDPRVLGPVKKLFRSIAKPASRIALRLLQKGRPVLLKDSYFPRRAELELVLRTRGRLWPNVSPALEIPDAPVDHALRGRLADLLADGDAFERTLSGMIPLDLPSCYLEAYPRLSAHARENYPPRVRALFTSVALHFDEAFKHWAAEQAAAGAKILLGQHGGSYGSVSLFPTADHETGISDRFYSWGWDRPAYGGKVRPMPAPFLSDLRRLGADDRREGILFGMGYLPRYFFIFPYMPAHFEHCLRWQDRFFSSLGDLRSALRIRLHREDLGWDIAERLQEGHPQIRLEDWSRTFRQSLSDCRLFVCDNLMTTFIEALAADKPTILFWDPRTNALTPEAEPYYEELRRAGILYSDPEEAAAAVRAAYADVNTWWNDAARREARERFCRRFARTSSGAVKDWAAELGSFAT